MKTAKAIRPHIMWFYIWVIGFSIAYFWCSRFLFDGSFMRLKTAMINSGLIAVLSVIIALILSWSITITSVLKRNNRVYLKCINYFFNILKSVPQIIGLLIGYLMVIQWMNDQLSILLCFSIITGLVIFKEMYELMSEQIKRYWDEEFVQASLTSGVREYNIINFEILIKKSSQYIISKCLSLFGTSIFLQTSVDYIISVGLSRNFNLVEYPVTLGNLLARSDSKQDILAVSRVFFDPSKFGSLFFEHLQGVSIAFLIIFSLFCFYKITSEFMRYYKL